MKPITNFTRLIPIVIAVLLIASSIFLVIPASREAVFTFFGLVEEKPVYNGFEPFIPFVPGYFPDDFDIGDLTEVILGVILLGNGDLAIITECKDGEAVRSMVFLHGPSAPAAFGRGCVRNCR